MRSEPKDCVQQDFRFPGSSAHPPSPPPPPPPPPPPRTARHCPRPPAPAARSSPPRSSQQPRRAAPGAAALRKSASGARAARAACGPSAPPAARMSDWVEHTDQGSGKTYYYSASTGQTSWEKVRRPCGRLRPGGAQNALSPGARGGLGGCLAVRGVCGRRGRRAILCALAASSLRRAGAAPRAHALRSHHAAFPSASAPLPFAARRLRRVRGGRGAGEWRMDRGDGPRHRQDVSERAARAPRPRLAEGARLAQEPGRTGEAGRGWLAD